MKKTALITGASRGIGAELARKLAHNGWHVAINYCSNKEKAQAVLEDILRQGGNGGIFCADITDFNAVQKMCAEIGETHLLINNAGIAGQKLFIDITEQEWDQMFAVHVKGAFNTIKCVLESMMRRGAGEIINVSSICAKGYACESHYSAAKAAVTSMTNAIAREVENSGVIVRSVELCAVDTDMHKKLKVDYQKMTGQEWDENIELITVQQAVAIILKGEK